MKTYQVKTGDVLISDAIIAVAKKHNFPTYSAMLERKTHRPYLLINTEGRLDWNQKASDRYQTVTVVEFIELLKSPPPPPIMIGEHAVEFNDDEKGITVGCMFVPTETVDKIHARLHEGEN